MPLERSVESLPDGTTRVFKPKTAKAIWRTIKAELQVAGVVDKASMFVPDGASTFGAVAAEGAGGVAQPGENVSYYLQCHRNESDLGELEVMHCSAHRGALCAKDVYNHNQFSHQWQSLLSKQWYHFQESCEGLVEFKEILTDLKCEVLTPLQGSFAKRVGFAECQDRDLKQWDAKKQYWANKVAAGSANCDESSKLYKDCLLFYSSMRTPRNKNAGIAKRTGFCKTPHRPC